MIKKTFVLVHEMARRRAIAEVQTAPDGFVTIVCEPNRTLDQNAAQWPYLQGFAEQKQLCINGVMQWATEDDWKDVITGCFDGESAGKDGRMKVRVLPMASET